MGNSDFEHLQSIIRSARESGKNTARLDPNHESKDGAWHISDALRIPSGFTLYVACRIVLEAGTFCNIVINENAYAENASAQKPDENIRIIGLENAELDGGKPNGLTEKTSETNGLPHIVKNTSLLFRNVRNFSVENLKVSNPRWWGMTFIRALNGHISNISFSADNAVPNQDGVDLRKGCSHIAIENITGTTGDDSVALTALSGRLEEKILPVIDGENDIHDITIKNVNTYVTGGHHIVRLLNHDGNRIYNISIDGITDACPENGLRARAALRIGDVNYVSVRPAIPGETDKISARNFRTRAYYGVLIGNPNLTNSEFFNIENREGAQFGFAR